MCQIRNVGRGTNNEKKKQRRMRERGREQTKKIRMYICKVATPPQSTCENELN